MSLLGTRVKVLREANKWTQEELAAKSGVSVTTISRYENERVAMFSGDVLARLAAALGVDAGLLLVTLKEPPPKSQRRPLRVPASASPSPATPRLRPPENRHRGDASTEGDSAA